MIPYFIASLPRSRTAWLANFLTYGSSYCFHEPMNKVPLERYPNMLQSTGTVYAGVSDSLNTLVMEQLIDLFPKARIVVIRRPVNEVTISLQKAGLPDCPKMLERMDLALDQIERAYSPLQIEYDEFDTERIWRFLMPEVTFPRKRYQMLENFNITVPAPVSRFKGLELLTKAGDLFWPLIA